MVSILLVLIKKKYLQRFLQLNSMNLVDLPDHIIEEILDCLHLEDLKSISRTRKYFYWISWNIKNTISKIKIKSMLYTDEVEVLKNTETMFENVELAVVSRELLQGMLGQISAITSMKITRLNLGFMELDDLQNVLPVIRNHEQEIETIVIDILLSPILQTIGYIESIFPSAELVIKYYLMGTETIDTCLFDKFNITELSVIGPCNIVFKKDIDRVRKLVCTNPNGSLRHFKNLVSLDVTSQDSELLKDLTEINKGTLTKLSISGIKSWTYSLPYQLQHISVGGLEYPALFLKHQKYLKSLMLHGVSITDDLLSVLDKNEHLRRIEFSACKLESSMNNFCFLERVNEVKFFSTNIELMYTIFSNCKIQTVFECNGPIPSNFESYLKSSVNPKHRNRFGLLLRKSRKYGESYYLQFRGIV